ncbi:MAG TPA: hypothetical protein PLE54_10665, partial [Burkholderiaceae bacterium]|nr:hypothetical protein [Burkholderiaceae bacterium]HQR71055.1 hypothetical protein [Burkholderiaceae bacterium]
FASADGQSAVYRRRSQVVLTSDSESDSGGQATSFALPDSEMKVRIDQYGYAKLVRPSRSTQHVDPLSNVVDGAADMEREAAQSVCAHLNEHVEAMEHPQRWTPPPDHQLVPTNVRAFPEPSPEMPKPIGEKGGKHVYDQRRMSEYLDERARWMKRRFAWEASQKELLDLAQRAAQGVIESMREHLLACLKDILWPLPVSISFEIDDVTAVRMDVQLPLLPTLPDREAAIDYGNRVIVRRMAEVIHTKLHNRHALGLVLRLVGEVFAALPTVQNVTVSARQQPPDTRPPRYVATTRVSRKEWTALHQSGAARGDAAQCLQQMESRFNLTGLGAFLPIEPFD